MWRRENLVQVTRMYYLVNAGIGIGSIWRARGPARVGLPPWIDARSAYGSDERSERQRTK